MHQGSLIYSVSIQMNRDIESAWLAWMHQEHMPEVMSTGFFFHCQLMQLIEPVDTEHGTLTYVAQYSSHTKDQIDQYIQQCAPALREKGFQRFGDQFIAFRTILQIC